MLYEVITIAFSEKKERGFMRFPGLGWLLRTTAVCLLLSGFCQAVYAADPVISEFLAKNVAGLQDASGAYPDWIEIYNP